MDNTRIKYFKGKGCVLCVYHHQLEISMGIWSKFCSESIKKNSNRGKKLVLLSNLRPKSQQNQTKLLRWGLLDRGNG